MRVAALSILRCRSPWVTVPLLSRGILCTTGMNPAARNSFCCNVDMLGDRTKPPEQPYALAGFVDWIDFSAG